MKKTTILTVVLAVLVLVSVVQAVQLDGLKEVVSEGQLTVKSASTTLPVANSPAKTTSSVPKSIQNLPQMVGGCWFNLLFFLIFYKEENIWKKKNHL